MKLTTFGFRLFLVLALVAACALGALCVYVPSERNVVGTYTSDSDSGAVVIDVKADGSFVQFDGGREISSGKWRLSSDYRIFKSLDLIGSYRLPGTEQDLRFGRGAMSYPLIHRSGKLCLDLNQEFVYWCKAK